MNLKELIDAAPDKGVVDVPPGTHIGGLFIQKSLTLIGGDNPAAFVIDAQGDTRVIEIEGPSGGGGGARGGLQVKLQGLTLRGGESNAGGGLALRGNGRVMLERCMVHGNRATTYGGGALYAQSGVVLLRDWILTEKFRTRGGAILADNDAKVSLIGCLLAANVAVAGGAVRLAHAAQLDAINCTFADNAVKGDHARGQILHLAGTGERRPRVGLLNCVLSGDGKQALFNHPEVPGTVEIAYSLVPPGLDAAAYLDGGHTVAAEPGFAPDTCNLSASSKARGLADARRMAQDAVDLWGVPRVVDGRADAGAYAFVPEAELRESAARA